MKRLYTQYRPFSLYGVYKPWQDEAAPPMSAALCNEDSQVELWYPVKKRPFECVAAFSSLLPLIAHYSHKIDEWSLVFQKCKVCGKDFLAMSRHYALCSDECRKAQSVVAKHEFDERAKDKNLERFHEAACYYWYNRQRKLKEGANPERLAAFSEAFAAFRKGAVKRKADVKSGILKFTDYTSWLTVQQDLADKLMGEVSPKLD
jgi:hypothetical protein